VRMPKFMMSLSVETLLMLKKEADERGITVQELMRAVVVPDWFRYLRKTEVAPKPWAK
jgi:hypothetical protein